MEALNPRYYQEEAFRLARNQDLIMIGDTGVGKTLVAIMLIRDFHSASYPDFSPPWSFFLSPTQALVIQHWMRLNSLLPHLRIGKYVSSENPLMDKWDSQQWAAEFDTHDVLCMTPAVLLALLHQGSKFLQRDHIGLVIMDECHHARKKHPYAMLMAWFRNSESNMSNTRVFGMTAVPNTDCIKVMGCKVYTCDREEPIIKDIAALPEVQAVWYPNDSIQQQISPLTGINAQLEVFISDLFSWFTNKHALPYIRITEDKFKNEMHFATQSLGQWAGLYAIIDFLNSLATKIASANRVYNSLENPEGSALSHKTAISLAHSLRCLATSLAESVEAKTPGDDLLPPKLHLLRQIVFENKAAMKKKSEKLQCLVFVERRITAKLLCRLLNSILAPRHIKCGFITGAGQSDYLKIVKALEQNTIQLLVATDVCKEGIDLTECNLVISYDHIKHARDLMQMRGRARAKSGKYLIMVSDQEYEAKLMKFIQEAEQIRNNIFQDGYRDSYPLKIKFPQYVLSFMTSAAVLDLDNAISVLFETVAKLISDDNLRPIFEIYDDWCKFRAKAILPTILKRNESTTDKVAGESYCNVLRSDFWDNFPQCATKKEARAVAAFVACCNLHRSGLLTDDLIPVDSQCSLQQIMKEQNITNIEEFTEDYSSVSLTPAKYLLCPVNLQEEIESCNNMKDLHVYALRSPVSDIGLVTKYEIDQNVWNIVCEINGMRKFDSFVCTLGESKIDQLVIFNERVLNFISESEPHGSKQNKLNPIKKMIIGFAPLTFKDSHCDIDWNVIAICLYESKILMSGEVVIVRTGPKTTRAFQLDHLTDITCKDYLNAIEGIKFKDLPKDWIKLGHLKPPQEIIEEESYLWYGSSLKSLSYVFRLSLSAIFDMDLNEQSHDRLRYLEPTLCQVTRLQGSFYNAVLEVIPIIFRLERFLCVMNLREELGFDFALVDLEVCLRKPANERLETLGDAWLKLYYTLYAFHAGASREQVMTEFRMLMISNQRLNFMAKKKNLNHYIHPKSSILADPFRQWHSVYVEEEHKWPIISWKGVADTVEALLGLCLTHFGEAAPQRILEWLEMPILEAFDNVECGEEKPAVEELEKWPWGGSHVLRDQLRRATKGNLISEDYVDRRPHKEQLRNTNKLEKLLNYDFRNKWLLLQALTHPSHTMIEPEWKYLTSALDSKDSEDGFILARDYQQLECLGDAVLSHITTTQLYCKSDPKQLTPGEITKRVSFCVRNATLGKVAISKLNIQEFIRISPTQLSDFESYVNASGVQEDIVLEPPKFLADVFEALMGAVYVDSELDIGLTCSIFWSLLEEYSFITDEESYDKFLPDERGKITTEYKEEDISLNSLRFAKEGNIGVLFHHVDALIELIKLL